MPQTLFATLRKNDEQAALPCFRIGFILDGMLDQTANRETVLQMLRLFRSDFGSQLAFMVLGSASGTPGKLVRFQDKKLQDWLVRIAEGFKKNRGRRTYGADQNPLGLPFLPYFSVDHEPYPLTRIEICLPWQAEGLLSFCDGIDRIAKAGNVRFGYQGFGFARSPVGGFQDRWLPTAFRRFYTALMGDVLGHVLFLFYSKPHVAMRRLDQARNGDHGKPWDYKPGIPDTAWRTYIGKIFADRLDLLMMSEHPDVVVETNDRMVVVTAGPVPIWGDLNKNEDISAWRSVYDFLHPAFASRNILGDLTLDCDRSDLGSVEPVQGYLNRFA